MKTRSINPSEIPLPKLHEHLLHAIAPRPIAFVTTIDKAGNVNLAPFSFFNCFGANPPVLVFSPALSGRTGASKNTHDNVKEVAECVVNIANYDIAYQMNLAAGMYPKGVDEFAKSGLTAIDSEIVAPPRVAECYVQFECVVTQVIETGMAGGAGNLVVCEVKRIHINENVLTEDGSIDPFKMNYIARMGTQYWCRVNADNMIKLPSFKHVNELGIGFDELPPGIRHSKYLTGNEIAQIATLHSFPAPEDVVAVMNSDMLLEMKEKHKNNFSAFEREAHLLAKKEIDRADLTVAFQILLAVEEMRTAN